jgi:hypothetical protein
MLVFRSETWTVGKEDEVERLESQEIKFLRHLWVPQEHRLHNEIMREAGRN